MISFRTDPDGTRVLTATQEFLRSLEEVFPFFADARNLERITPASLRFEILTPSDSLTMSEGLIIDYRIRIRGVPVRWRTRIAIWDPPHAFVDQQIRGPYALWLHTHQFEQIDGSEGEPARTRMTDIVRYRPPMGKLVGSIAHRLLVRSELRRIFEYRRRALEKVFGSTACAMTMHAVG